METSAEQRSKTLHYNSNFCNQLVFLTKKYRVFPGPACHRFLKKITLRVMFSVFYRPTLFFGVDAENDTPAYRDDVHTKLGRQKYVGCRSDDFFSPQIYLEKFSKILLNSSKYTYSSNIKNSQRVLTVFMLLRPFLQHLSSRCAFRFSKCCDY